MILLEKLRNLGQFDYSYHWSHSHIGYDRYEEGIAFLTSSLVMRLIHFIAVKIKVFILFYLEKLLGLTVSIKNQLIDIYSCHINLPGSEEEDQLDNIRTIFERTGAISGLKF